MNPTVGDISGNAAAIVERIRRAADAGAQVVVFPELAVPGYPPHEDLLRWLGEAASSTAYAGYGDIEGEPELRAAYALHVSELYGARIAASNVHITSGCNQAFVAAAMAVAGAGDAILVTNPWYFNHETTLRMLGIGVRAVDCLPERGFLPDPEMLAAALDPAVRAVALVSPNNPTGAVYPPELLAAIFDICRQNGVWLILDETYRDFLPPDSGRPHGLLAAPEWNEGLIQLYSFSKSFCIPGHRLGAVVAGEPVVAQIAKIMDNLQICAPRAPQAAVAKGLPALAEWRRANRAEIAARAAALVETLGETPWQVEAIGAYFAFVRHPYESENSVRVAERLAKEAGILTIPGGYFGRGQDRYLRFAFANTTADTIRTLHARPGISAASAS
jgi:aspartate/methionine/tyrosine aminotransferase